MHIQVRDVMQAELSMSQGIVASLRGNTTEAAGDVLDEAKCALHGLRHWHA